MSLYNVRIEFSGTWEDEVEADTESEAEEIARDEWSVSDSDTTIEYVYVECTHDAGERVLTPLEEAQSMFVVAGEWSPR
jgi:hypothetical protein